MMNQSIFFFIFRNISRAASAPDEEIKIPTRIERSPTDILEALAGTVKKDYTAPHYRSDRVH